MKKRYLSLFLILILISSIVSAAIPYKQSLKINNYKINKVECSNNYLRVLVESKTSSSLNLVFTIYSKTTNKIFTNQLLKAFESNYFLITTNKQCNELKRLEVNGYLEILEDTIIYLNSESSYKFTGKESSITTTETTTTEITQETTQTTQQITPTKYSYVYLNGNLLERVNLDNNNVNYFHQDHLGSNRVITDNNGNILSKNDYIPFGNELSFSSKSNYKFTGKEQDKSNLYYFGARYYDSSIGRFTSTDPVFSPIESSYSYARNNPIVYVDPTGAEEIKYPELIRKEITDPGSQEALALANFVSSGISTYMREIEDKFGIQFTRSPRLFFQPKPEGTAKEIDAEFWPDVNPPSIVYYVTYSTKDPKTGKIELDTTRHKSLTFHELGHFYVYLRAKQLGLKGFYEYKTENEYIAKLAITEGISEYIKSLVPKRSYSSYNSIELSNSKQAKVKSEFYERSYNVVKPVIDKYGSRGIDWLIRNPPTDYLTNLKSYVARGLDELAEPYHNKYRENR